jgi:hypothetical protein
MPCCERERANPRAIAEEMLWCGVPFVCIVGERGGCSSSTSSASGCVACAMGFYVRSVSTRGDAQASYGLHTVCPASSSVSSSWSSASLLERSPFTLLSDSPALFAAAAFFLFFFFCDLDRAPFVACQPGIIPCLTTKRDGEAEFIDTSESCKLTYHFVVWGLMYLAQTFCNMRDAVATTSRRISLTVDDETVISRRHSWMYSLGNSCPVLWFRPTRSTSGVRH